MKFILINLLPLGQARDLVNRMKTSDKIDYQNDWKLVNIFFGGNDACQYCLNHVKYIF